MISKETFRFKRGWGVYLKSLIRGQDSNEAELKLGQHKNCVFLEQTSHVYRKEQAEIPWASVSKSRLAQNLSYENEFDFRENSPFGETHFHMKTRSDPEAKDNSEMPYWQLNWSYHPLPMVN